MTNQTIENVAAPVAPVAKADYLLKKVREAAVRYAPKTARQRRWDLVVFEGENIVPDAQILEIIGDATKVHSALKAMDAWIDELAGHHRDEKARMDAILAKMGEEARKQEAAAEAAETEEA